MARPLRIQYPDAWYHVMNRGRRGEAVFFENQDYFVFIDILKETCNMWGIRVAAYCLMSNHYHLLLQTPQGNLDRCMRHINGIYTQRFNRQHQADGQLFRGRYKAMLVDADRYLLELVRYIHRNPLRAGLVAKNEDYPWSSHSEYASATTRGTWLCKEFILSILEKDKARQLKAYTAFVNQQDSESLMRVFAKKNLQSVLGEEGFIDRIKRRYFRLKRHTEIPQSKMLAPTIKEIKEKVSKIYHTNTERLCISKRGVDNEPRNIALYIARQLTGKKLEEIGKEFSISNYSTVSSVLCKINRQAKSNKAIQRRIAQIEDLLLKGQKQT
jgi:REP element-mobilizing transposase RayT